MREMCPNEAADFLEGYRRRGRNAWEVARAGWQLTIDAKGKSVTELFPLPWDTAPAKKKRTTKKEMDALRQRAQEIAKKINGK